MKKLFFSYIRNSILIVLMFLMINIILVCSIWGLLKKNTTDTDDDLQFVISQITTHKDGYQLSAIGNEFLHKKQLWCMILDQSGNVEWQMNLPDSLNHAYSITEVASFTRWYLEDYPVIVQNINADLLVIGYPADDVFGVSISKLYYVYDTALIEHLILAIVLLLVCNVFMLIYLSYKNAQNMTRIIQPVLIGIEQLANGKPVTIKGAGYVSNVILSLQKASTLLSQKEEARAMWINGISHDIRTPLSLILGYSNEIAESSVIPFQIREDALRIEKQGKKLGKLVENLNLVSRLEYSMQPLRKQNVDINELIRQIVSDLYNEGLDQTMDINLSLTSESTQFMGDADLLKRLIENLINNSIQHNTTEVSIEIETSVENNKIIILYYDTGIGLTENQLSQFNQGFIPMQNYKTGGIPAHGVGTKIILDIVKAHNGSITFAQNKPSGICVQLSFCRDT